MEMYTTTITSSPLRGDAQHPSFRRLAFAGGATAVTAAAANVLVRTMGVAAGTVPASYAILQPGAVVSASIVGILLASVLLAGLWGLRSQPVSVFRAIVLVGALLSLGAPLLAAAGKMQGTPAPSAATAGTRMLMHGTVAIMAAFVLPALVRRGAQEPGNAKGVQPERVHECLQRMEQTTMIGKE